jgi:hypothetical protein
MDTAVVLPKPKGSRNGPNSNTKRSNNSGSSSNSASGQSITAVTAAAAAAADDGTGAAALEQQLEQQLEPMQIASDSDTPAAAADTTTSSNAAAAVAATGDSTAAAAEAVNNSSANGSSSGSHAAAGGSSDQRAAKGREMRELDYCGMLNRALPPEIRYVWHVSSMLQMELSVSLADCSTACSHEPANATQCGGIVCAWIVVQCSTAVLQVLRCASDGLRFSAYGAISCCVCS